MLHKMGWSGDSGLGRKEQGIFNPVEAGEVRERNEMYKGIGAPVGRNDPFEAFRKNKSQGYIQRLRDRDDSESFLSILYSQTKQSNLLTNLDDFQSPKVLLRPNNESHLTTRDQQ